MKPYKFSTLKERFQIGGLLSVGLAAVLGVVLFAAGPVAVAATAAGGLLMAAHRLRAAVTASSPGGAENEGALPKDSAMVHLLEETARRFGLKFVPRAFFKKTENFNTMDFNANLVTRALYTTHASFESHSVVTPALRFVVAHETAHLRVDSRYVHPLVTGVMEYGSKASIVALLFSGGIGAMAAGVAMWYGARWIAALSVMKASRLRETRADRNALYVTRDMHTAAETLRSAEGMSFIFAPRESRLQKLLRSHPDYQSRVDALRKSFKKVSRYPVPTASPLKGPAHGL